MHICDVVGETQATAAAHGWSSAGRSLFMEKMLLVISEISEAVELFRVGKDLSDVWFVESKETPGVQKPEGIPVEIADALIRLLEWCGSNGIDVEAVLRVKMDYNKSRPFRHGGKQA